MKIQDRTSFVATFFAIVTNVTVAAQMYAYFQDSLWDSNIYNFMEAIGSISMGFLSDKFCRRKTNILIHSIGLVLLCIILTNPHWKSFIFMLGFFYNPMPILRAGLVDNFTRLPRLNLLTLSFVAQFLPWIFYNLYTDIPVEKAATMALTMLTISFVGSLLFFHDKRDKNTQQKTRLKYESWIHPSAKKRVLYTFVAFICMQLAFFCSDNLLEKLSDEPRFYSVMSFVTIIGVLLVLLFVKVAHSSVLRITYGFMSCLSIIPIAGLFLYHVQHFDAPSQVIILATLTSFCLPFIYDITMNSINANYRGTACGVLDFGFNLATMFNTSLIVFFGINELFTYLLIFLGLAAALFFQTKADPKVA